MTNIVESVLNLAIIKWLADEQGIVAEEIVSVEQDSETEWFGCDTCRWTYTVIEIRYRESGFQSQSTFTYRGDFGEFIRALG